MKSRRSTTEKALDQMRKLYSDDHPIKLTMLGNFAYFLSVAETIRRGREPVGRSRIETGQNGPVWRLGTRHQRPDDLDRRSPRPLGPGPCTIRSAAQAVPRQVRPQLAARFAGCYMNYIRPRPQWTSRGCTRVHQVARPDPLPARHQGSHHPGLLLRLWPGVRATRIGRWNGARSFRVRFGDER